MEEMTTCGLRMYLLLSVSLCSLLSIVKSMEIEQYKQGFLQSLIDEYGTNGFLTETEFKEFSEEIGLDPSYTVDSNTCNMTVNNSCAFRCLGYEAIFRVFSVDSKLNSTTLDNALSAIVFSVQDKHCHHSMMEDEEDKEETSGISTTETWGLGFGSASVIVFIANIGALFKPCMKSKGFQRIMYLCVALAVGTLGATGILVLIPEALNLAENNTIPGYKWKLVAAIGGIYVFFVLERCLQIQSKKKKTKGEKQNGKELEPLQNDVSHGHSHGADKGVATVAWTLLIGDALHNFADGLAMGAAYTESITVGLSVSIAILTEELPHELGDIAILLHSGMNMKRALLYNFLAAVTIYLGLIIGIIVGSNTNANAFIFAFTGGLFIYIALADMIPEMNIQARNASRTKKDSDSVVFFYQNLGLLIGFAIVIIISAYGPNISV